MNGKLPIYFDMDGVLVDLDKFFRDRYGEHDKDLDRVRVDADMHTIAPTHVFRTLDPMPDFHHMRLLMSFLKGLGYTVNILSSVTEHEYRTILEEDKRIWLNDHQLWENGSCCDSHYFVPGSVHKGRYAPGLLIDDWHRAGLAFSQQPGGYWIKHTSFVDTYLQLYSLFPSQSLPSLEWWMANMSEKTSS